MTVLSHIHENAKALTARYSNASAHQEATNTLCDLFSDLVALEKHPPLLVLKEILSNLHQPQSDTDQTLSADYSSHSQRLSQALTTEWDSNEQQQLLRNMGVSINADGNHNYHEKLRLAAKGAIGRAKETFDSVLSSTDMAIVSHLDSISRARESLLETLLADTSYGTAQTVSNRINSRRALLDISVGEIGSRLANVSMTASPEITKQRDAFVDRWGRD